MEKRRYAGFTLVEILIVIALIATLGAIAALILNPVEYVKRGRDSRRLQDYTLINNALNTYTYSASLQFGDPDYDGPNFTESCANQSEQRIFVSVPADNGEDTPDSPSNWTYQRASSTSLREIDGNGWLPVDFTSIDDELQPLHDLPLDPVNSFNSGYYYTYTCGSYEINVRFESQKFQEYAAADGGDDDNIFELGNNLRVAPQQDAYAIGLVASSTPTVTPSSTYALAQAHYRWRSDNAAESGGWLNSTIVSSVDNVGAHSSLEEVGGILYLSYGNTTAGTLSFVKSTDGGLSWSSEYIIDNARAGNYNDLFALDSQHLYLAYHDSLTGLYFVSSSDGGATWGAPQNIIIGADYGRSVDVFAVSTSSIYLSYYNFSTGGYDVYSSPDGGSTWSSSQLSSSGGSNMRAPLYAFNTGTVVATYIDNTLGGLYFARSSDGGNSWASKTQIAPTPAESPDLVYAGSNTYYISYFDGFAAELRYAVSTNGGINWNYGIVDSSIAFNHGQYPSIDAIGPSTVAIAAYDITNSRLLVARSTDGAATWTVEYPGSSAIAAGANSSIELTLGETYISHYDGYNADLLFSKYPGSGAPWVYPEDMPATSFARDTQHRLRFLVENIGGSALSGVNYGIQYARALAGPWNNISAGPSGAAWEIRDSIYISDGEPTTNLMNGLTDPSGKMFQAGELKDSSNKTSGIGLSSNQFTEIEYSLYSTTYASGTYYFRLVGDDVPFQSYIQMGQATVY